MERLLSVDALNGISTYHDYDPQTDTTIIRSEGDCEAVLDLNKKMANDTDYTKRGIKNEFWHYATIPAIIQHKWLVEDGIRVWDKADAARVSKKLNDPDWQYLKTTAKKCHFK